METLENISFTPKEFESSNVPLAMIISVDPKTGEALWEYYDWRVIDSFKKDFEKDFPNMFHFTKHNFAAKKEKAKELFNYDLTP